MGFAAAKCGPCMAQNAERKARRIANMALARAGRMLKVLGLPDFTETSVEIIGAETHYGAARSRREYREVQLKVAARHPARRALPCCSRNSSVVRSRVATRAHGFRRWPAAAVACRPAVFVPVAEDRRRDQRESRRRAVPFELPALPMASDGPQPSPRTHHGQQLAATATLATCRTTWPQRGRMDME